MAISVGNGNVICFSPTEYNRFQLGYAATVHKSQGVTVDETYVLATPHFDQHTTYVAMSRHKHHVMLYGSERDFKSKYRLYSMLGKDGEKLSTLEFVAEQIKAKTQTFTTRIQRVWQRLRGKQQEKSKDAKTAPIQKNWIEPQRSSPSIAERDRVLAAAKSQRQADAPLTQQEFSVLRDEFIKQAEHSDQNKQHQHRHQPRGPTMER